MAYRIVAKSPEKLDDILTDIKEWFTSTKDYVAKLDTEKRKFAESKEIKVGHRFNDDGRIVTIVSLDPKRGEVEVEDTKGMSYFGEAETFGFKFIGDKLYTATKQIVSKDIDIIYVKDTKSKKETKIMLIPLLKPGEMKVEIGGENEHVMKGKIKNMMKGRGDFKSYNKDTLRKMEAVETLRNIIREEIAKIIKQG